MIITCNECSTNFNLNESLLKPEGTKVRCSVCNSIFKAFPPVESIPATGLEVPVFEPKHTYVKTDAYDDIKTDSPAASGDSQNGMIAYLELDEKSLGIEDIISDIIFIPKEPEDFEPETISESELVPDIMPAKGKGKEDTRPAAPGFDKDSNGELTDLDLTDDSELDLDDDFDLVEEIPSEEDEHQDIDIEFSPEDIGDTAPAIDAEPEIEALGVPLESKDEIVPADELELEDELEPTDELEDELELELFEDSPEGFETLEGVENGIEDKPDDTEFEDTDFEFETELTIEETDLSDDTEMSFDEDGLLEMDESAMEFKDDESVLEEESDVFEFDEDDTISLEPADSLDDEFSGALEPVDEDDLLDAPDFTEGSDEFEAEDEFEFDTDGELTLIDDDLPEENELSFDNDSLEEEDMLVLEDDSAQFEDDGDLLLEEEDGLEFAEIETEMLEDDGDMLVSDDWSDSGPDEDRMDEITGAFELEFDVDADLELDDDAHDPGYLVQASSDGGEDTLEMMEIETENDGDAFLEDFSSESDLSDYDDSLEEDLEPEIIIDDDEDTGSGMGLTKASIERPLPPPLTSAHLGKVKKAKKGGSKIVSFFLFLVFLAIVLLLTYSAAIMTGTKIPYISDLKIPLIDQYLKPPAPLPEPARVHPTEQSVSGSFVANESAGTLFVITGKVLNDSNIFVSRVKVRGSLIADGKVKVKETTVFCGNILTKEQLEKGNITDLNKLLQRSSGENNSNIKIKPQGSVQFMIVFSELPELLQNFEVEVVEFDRNDKGQ